MITLLFTDALVAADDLDSIFRRTIDRTFNCVSIDTDTSTSDTAIVLASGAAGPVDLDAFERGLYDVAASLTKQVARDGEGAEKLIEVTVEQAGSAEQAKRVAKAIVNSPLVKTAVHGADPNWGRVAMAIGKSTTADEVDQSKVVIRFGHQEVYPSPGRLRRPRCAAEYMRGAEVRITASLAAGDCFGDGVGLRPHRRLRADQRRLHHLTITDCPPGAPMPALPHRPLGRLRVERVAVLARVVADVRAHPTRTGLWR